MSAVSACRVGVDIGGTGTRAVSVIGTDVAIAKDVPTALLGAGAQQERIRRLGELILDVVPEGASLTHVGIGASGPVDVNTGIVTNDATLPWFSGFALPAQLENEIGVPVAIDNDAVAAAYGEHALGAGRGADRLMMVTLGTGVGVAMLVGGRPVRGRGNAHPEAGHIPVNGDAVRCYCGLTGCWEQSASRSALQTMLGAAMGGAAPTRGLIADALNQEERNAQVREAFEEYAWAVGRGLAALHTLFQPDRTVIGGSAAIALAGHWNAVRSAQERSSDFAVDVELRLAELGDTAGAIGSALGVHRV